MTFLSLFAGIGGFDLGLERAGMRCIGQVENDPFCQKVLTKHWPNVPKFGDIRDFKGTEIDRPDLICGGFPCQPVSRAGNQLAQNDPRWMWPEFGRLVRTMEPDYVVVENTPGLFDGGFGDVLGDLAAFGLDAEWCMLSACAFGAPHTRDRVFIVAYRHKIGRYWPGRDTHGCNGILFRSEWQASPNSPQWIDMECWLVETHENGDWGKPSTQVRGVDDGIPDRLDRIGAIGNAVVPQIAEWIGRRIIASTDR